MKVEITHLIIIVLLICIFIVNILKYLNANKSQKVPKSIRRIYGIFINLVIALIFLGFSIFIGDNYDSLYKIIKEFALLLWSLSIYFGVLYLVVFLLEIFELINQYIRKYYNENKKKQDSQMIFWLGSSMISERFLFDIFGDKLDDRYDDIKNIEVLQNIFKQKLGDDVIKYELLKNHLEFKVKDPFYTKVLYVLLTPILGAIVTILVKNSSEYLNEVKELLEKAKEFKGLIQVIDFIFSIPGVSLLFIIIIFLYCIYILSKSVYLVFTEKNRTIKYLISVLDIIISDIKDK